MASRQVNLEVNNVPVPIDYFVQGFIDHVMRGILEALEGTGPIRDLKFSIDRDIVTIDLNGSVVPTNTFVNKIVRNTVAGMVTSLKGVGKVKKIDISIKR